MDKVEEITKRNSTKVWKLHNALTDPDQLEFKVDPLEAPENFAKQFHEEHRQIHRILQIDCASQAWTLRPFLRTAQR